MEKKRRWEELYLEERLEVLREKLNELIKVFNEHTHNVEKVRGKVKEIE